MADIKCLTLTQTIPANEYKTMKGNKYFFQINQYTRVDDKEDIEYFRNAGKGLLFEVKGVVGKLIEKIIPPKKQEIKKYTEKELYAMEKPEQEKIIYAYDKNQKMPINEKGRVALILNLQK
jgi:hypothetical protein